MSKKGKVLPKKPSAIEWLQLERERLEKEMKEDIANSKTLKYITRAEELRKVKRLLTIEYLKQSGINVRPFRD